MKENSYKLDRIIERNNNSLYYYNCRFLYGGGDIMNNWNKPEIKVLDINETANGILDVDYEGHLTDWGAFLFKKQSSPSDKRS